MSKAVKRKISVELQPKSSSKSRLSVFQRLGTKKSKSISDSKSLTDDFKQTLSAAVSIKPILTVKKPDVELDDADPSFLEKKRQEIQKELELQMKMDSRRAAVIRKRKRAPSSSESSSSSSESESSSSSSSSTSSDDRHKSRKLKNKHRDSSSSSDEYAKKLAKKKRSCHKKEALKLHKISKKHEMAAISRKVKRHSTSPVSKKHRSDSSSALLMSPSGQKVMMKNLKVSASIDKHHRLREKEVERTELLQREQKERERERMRMRDDRMHGSRSPKLRRSRSAKREFPRRSPVLKRSQSPKPSRSLSRRMDSCERERSSRDLKERDLTRDKGRHEVLVRAQERPRDHERVAKDAKGGSRLLPRPAERAMALAAAQERRSAEKDHVPTYPARSYVDRTESFEHRRVKEKREHERPYDSRREPNEYPHGGSYRREWNDTTVKDREWHDENPSKDIYDRHQTTREWDHKRNETTRSTGENYSERKEWSESNPKWESRKNSSWQQENESGWNNRYKEDNWQDSNQQSSSTHHNRSIGEKSTEHGTPSSISKPIGGGVSRRGWNTWRGRGRGSHHGDFRRTHHHTEILEERGEIYRRHINPQGANATKPSTPKPLDSQSQTSIDKAIDEPSKATITDDAEEIADDLSEISDEADDILGQQEESQTKSQTSEKIDENPMTEGSETNQSSIGQKELNETEVDKLNKDEDKVSVQEQIPAAKSPEEHDRSKDLGLDIDLDFEEISDGELEEEARIKGLGDALGVDWAGLVEESKAILREKLSKTETSVKQRWDPNQILLDTGISYKMAGRTFAEQTLIHAHETLKAQTANDIKLEIVNDNHIILNIKKEPGTEETTKLNGKHDSGLNEVENDTGNEKNDENKLVLHPLPCVQISARSMAQNQHRIIFNATGPYSRGLCTKRDIAMRRQLCNLAINETNCKSGNSKNGTGYEAIALKLFQKALQA